MIKNNMSRILVFFLLILIISCTEKKPLVHVKVKEIYLNLNNPNRHTEALDLFYTMNVKEKKKYREVVNSLWEEIYYDYLENEKKGFLTSYGKTKLAYAEDQTLYIENLDGTEKRVLVKGYSQSPEIYFTNMKWSPNGKYIVSDNGFNKNIILIDVKSGGIIKLTNGRSDQWPNWSPDSKKIVFSRNDGFQCIEYNIETKQEKVIYPFSSDEILIGSHPFYISTNNVIAINRDNKLELLNKKTLVPLNLTQTTTDYNFNLRSKLLLGLFINNSTSKSLKYFVTRNDTYKVFTVDGEFVSELPGTSPNWGVTDDYIMYTGAFNHIMGTYIKPLNNISDKYSLHFYINDKYDSIWCPIDN